MCQMVELIKSIVESQNLVPILLFLLILVIPLGILISKGKFSLSLRGVSLGDNSAKIKVYLLKASNFIHEYCSSQQVILILKMKEVNFIMNPLYVNMVFQSVEVEMYSWLLVNYIEASPEYIKQRSQDCLNIVLVSMNQIQSKIVSDAKLLSVIIEFSNTFTQKAIEQIAQIKKDTLSKK